jgi:phosphoribosylaminoimidazole-succinocarboxamide synthase
MTPLPSTQSLIDMVTREAPDESPLMLLQRAAENARDLEQTGDELLDHFVENCRANGLSWSQISGVLGVSKQAAHKRFSVANVFSGKVRNVYEAGPDHLLMVASDRISAFDRVFEQPIPDKGAVLTAMTAFWSEALAPIAKTHLVSVDPIDFPAGSEAIGNLAGRTMLVRRAKMLEIECIVRGYITGSAWKEYRTSGTMHGTVLPSGLRESDRLPEPVFTPSTKAPAGDHDVNISFEQAATLVGTEIAERAREISITAYLAGARIAEEQGIVIADTKFELGFVDGELIICDEILTPDSSRFWPADQWTPGATPPSFDKQPVRDWAESTGWDKNSTPPTIPDDVIAETRERYITAFERISGRSFASWMGGLKAGA